MAKSKGNKASSKKPKRIRKNRGTGQAEIKALLTSEQVIFLDVYQKAMLNKSLAAKRCNIGRSTIHKWISENPAFADAMKEAEEAMIDMCESTLYKIIFGYTSIKKVTKEALDREGNVHVLKETHESQVAPNATAILKYLFNKGKDRGWVDRTVVANELIGPDLDEKMKDNIDRMSEEERLLLAQTMKKVIGE